MNPAVKTLERLGVRHATTEYLHDPNTSSYGQQAIDALGVSATQVFKTLVVMADAQPVVGVIPVESRLSLKAIARAAQAKKAVLADPDDAERLTGYVVGGISPIGQKRLLPTFIDQAAEDLDVMYISGGRRGLEIEIKPFDLAQVTEAQFAAISQQPQPQPQPPK